MRIRAILKWLIMSTSFKWAAFTTLDSLPGQRNITPSLYDSSALKGEFGSPSLPNEVIECFEQALKEQLEGHLTEALELYFSGEMTNVSWNGGFVTLSEGSAIVSFNVYAAYTALGDHETARIYFAQYTALQAKLQLDQKT